MFRLGLPRAGRSLVVLVAVIVTAVVTAVAYAAVTSRQVYAEGTNLKYHFVRTAADGFDSGWHVHPGLVIVQVEEGALQFTQGSCTPKTVAAGETFIEVPWKPVRAVASGRAVWTTTIFVPATEQLLIPLAAYSPGQPNPCP